MGSENALNKKLNEACHKYQHIYQRFEDKLTGGIPDRLIEVNGQCVWVEGKQVDDFPKRENTVVLQEKDFRKDQQMFLLGWGAKTNRAFLLTQVKRTYYLHGWMEVARMHFMGKKEFVESAHFKSGSLDDRFFEALLSYDP